MFKYSYDKNCQRKLHQGVVSTRLWELKEKEKVLWGKSGSGKTELILHYMLHYWQIKKEKIIVSVRADRMNKWRILSKRILKDEMSFSYKITDNTNILLITSAAIPFHYFSEVELRNASYYYSQIPTPSNYGLTIVDEETVIGSHSLTRETIFVQRPNHRLRGPLKRIKEAPSVFLKKLSYKIPTPIYHSTPFISSFSLPEQSAENIIEKIIEPYNKILIIGPIYDSVFQINIKSFASDSTYIYDNNYGSTIDRDDVLNTCHNKKCIMQFFNYDAINSEIHADLLST